MKSPYLSTTRGFQFPEGRDQFPLFDLRVERETQSFVESTFFPTSDFKSNSLDRLSNASTYIPNEPMEIVDIDEGGP